MEVEDHDGGETGGTRWNASDANGEMERLIQEMFKNQLSETRDDEVAALKSEVLELKESNLELKQSNFALKEQMQEFMAKLRGFDHGTVVWDEYVPTSLENDDTLVGGEAGTSSDTSRLFRHEGEETQAWLGGRVDEELGVTSAGRRGQRSQVNRSRGLPPLLSHEEQKLEEGDRCQQDAETYGVDPTKASAGQKSNNIIQWEDEEKHGETGRSRSWVGREKRVTHYFQDSIYFMLITEHVLSVGFMFALATVLLAVVTLFLVIVSSLDEDKEDNPLDIPAGVSPMVRAAQILGALIGMLTEQETAQGIVLIHFAMKYSLQLIVDRKKIRVKNWKVMFCSLSFLVVGYLFLINLVFVILKADEVLTLFFDIVALEFVLHVDDLAFMLCNIGIFGRKLQDSSQGIHNVEVYDPSTYLAKQRYSKRFYLLNFVGVFVTVAVFMAKQEQGAYGCQSVTVTFGDETWEGAQARVNGKSEQRVLLYSYFSGVYKRDGTTDGYPRYVEQNKATGERFESTTGAEIIYCKGLASWVFVHENIYRTADEAVDENAQDKCSNWLMRSSETQSFDFSSQKEWDIWVGTIQTGASLSVICNDCEDDLACNYHGECKQKECICFPQFFGQQCQWEMPCKVLVTENVELQDRTQLLRVSSNTTKEKFVMSYNRPIYTINGLSGVPEGLLSVDSRSHGHTSDDLYSTEKNPFEDDDFFREPRRYFEENILEDNFFDFGGTNISLRNYAVILAFAGSRWFGTIDRPDFDVKKFYNTEYHAFWQKTYSERTFLVSGPTSRGSPVGVEFFSPRRRKSDNDYGPFGVLLPNSDIDGVGFFQCYVNSETCTILDISVSTQNKSLPSNIDQYFSEKQRVSWELELVEGNTRQVEKGSSSSVLLGSEFTHKYCLADGTYTFQMTDEVCKSSWWECENKPGKSGYNLTIDGVQMIDTYGIFQKSKFTFSVLNHDSEWGSEDKRHSFCSNSANFNVMIHTDGSPYETSWHLTDAKGSLILTSGPYPFYKTFTNYNDHACLTDGWYNFTMLDSGQDGMNPPGHYDLIVGGNYVVRGGHLFGSSSSTQFNLSGSALSLAPHTSPSTTSPNDQYSSQDCSVVFLDVAEPFALAETSSVKNPLSGFGSIMADLTSEIIFWSLLDSVKHAYVFQDQQINWDDPKAPCLYEGAYTYTYESIHQECVGNGLDLIHGTHALPLYAGPICRNVSFSFLVMTSQEPKAGHKRERKEHGTSYTSLHKGCMNDFHLVVPKDIFKNAPDTSWELSGRDGVIMKGDQFGDLSSFYSHRACLRPGTYKFVTWKDPTAQYYLSYQRTTLLDEELNLDSQYPGAMKSVVFDGSTLYFNKADIGVVGTFGESSISGVGDWLVAGAGAGIGGNADSFHYLHMTGLGDLSFTMFVENFSSSSPELSVGGIMFRDVLDAGSTHYSMLVTGQNGLQNSYRRTCQGCETFSTNNDNAFPQSIWLRVTKEGNQFKSFYREVDSDEWTQFGSTIHILFSHEEFSVGIAVTGHNKTSMATLEARNVELVALREVHEYSFTLWDERKILPDDGAPTDNFGLAVALDDNTLVIAADDCDDTTGSAYIFICNGQEWVEQTKIFPRDVTREYNTFGHAIALDGNTLIVTDPSSDEYIGCAYVFIRNGDTWIDHAKIQPHEAEQWCEFGWTAVLDGDTLLIGTNSELCTSAYVFIREGEEWKEQAKIQPQDGTEGVYFTHTIALDGDTIVLGSSYYDNYKKKRAAHVFIRDGEEWLEQAELVPQDGASGYAFGYAVALEGDTIVVTAPNYADNGKGGGSAHVFTRDGEMWNEQAKLLPQDGASNHTFGNAVALEGDIIVITSAGLQIVSVHVFTRHGDVWQKQDIISPHDGAQEEGFEWAMALEGNLIVLGAHGDDSNGVQSGAAYIFSTSLPDLAQAKNMASSTAPASSPASLVSSFLTTYCTDVAVGIDVLTDSYPYETEWTLSRIINTDGTPTDEIFLKGSAVNEFREANTHYSYTDVMCLERGEYKFTISDSMGDGLCCLCGEGHYKITLDGQTIARGGEFADKETVPFFIPLTSLPSALHSTSLSPSQMPSITLMPTVSSHPTTSLAPSTAPTMSSSPTNCFAIEINILTDEYYPETTWTLSRIIDPPDKSSTEDDTSSTQLLLEGHPEDQGHHADEVCLERGDYVFTIYDDDGDGILWPGYYNIAVGGEVIAGGSDLGYNETVVFSIPWVPCTSNPGVCGCANIRLNDYRGSINETRTGAACEPWDAEWIGEYFLQVYPNAGLQDGNSCRNPDYKSGGPWCFTLHGLDFCDVPTCDEMVPFVSSPPPTRTKTPLTSEETIPAWIPTSILTSSPSATDQSLTKQPSTYPTKTATTQTLLSHSSSETLLSSPPTATLLTSSVDNASETCQKVEVGVFFNNSPVGLGWAILDVKSQDGGIVDTTGVRVSSGPLADANRIQTVCLEEGKYNFVIFDYYGNGGIENYYVKSNEETIVQGGEFDQPETTIFDIPFVP